MDPSMYKNTTGISLSVAVWLAHDEYQKRPGYSVTQLIKPAKAIVLAGRIQGKQVVNPDIISNIDAKIGTAVHSSIENSWHHNYKASMDELGYPSSIIDKIVVNPASKLNKGDIPVYLETYATKVINNISIGGTFDFCVDGQLEDFKTTSVYSYIKKSNDESHQLQGSMYRWLNQDIITEDTIIINYIFKDWTLIKSITSKDYPPAKSTPVKIPLLSIPDTERFITSKLNLIATYNNKQEFEMIPCTDKELWMEPSVWKYYKNPAKTTRSTKNFDNPSDAYSKNATDGSKGLVLEVKSEARACRYCEALPVCKQAEDLVLNGKLKL
jgi:hypothetical protein